MKINPWKIIIVIFIILVILAIEESLDYRVNNSQVKYKLESPSSVVTESIISNAVITKIEKHHGYAGGTFL